jgi:hypothetical protein
MPLAMPSCATFDTHSTSPAPLAWVCRHNFFVQITDVHCDSASRNASRGNPRFTERHRRRDCQPRGKPVRRRRRSELRLPGHQASPAERSFGDQP